MESSLDNEIVGYLQLLDNSQKKEILTVIKSFVSEKEKEDFDTEGYSDEMNRRFAEFENGNVKGITLEEAEAKARAAYALKKNK